MRFRHYAQLAARESRRSRVRMALFMACIAVGVAAVVVVDGLSTGVNDEIRAQGRRLMAADVSIEGRRELPATLDEVLQRFTEQATRGGIGAPVQRADVRELLSVVASAGNSQLAELKAVDAKYPFYGTLELDRAQSLAELLAPDAVVVAPELLDRMDLGVGDELRIGGVPFRIAGVVLEEPDKLSISFVLGPRVFISHDGLARTALVGLGSRVEHRALLKLPEGASANDAKKLGAWLQGELPDATYYRIRTFTEAQPALRRSFERMGRYLGLVGLLSLLIGGVGVAQVVRAWLAGRMDDIAILRCLGARPAEVVVLFLAQVLALSLFASLVGAALGTGLHAILPHVLGDLLPADLIRPWQPAALWRGLLLGLSTTVLFTLPLLLDLRRVPPVRVLRRDAEPVPAGRWTRILAGMLLLVGIGATASAQAESIRHGAIFTAGLAAAVILLALAAAGVSRVTRFLPRGAGGLWLRHGLAHLARPGVATVGAIIALGLGVTFVFATRVVQRHLNEQLRAELPDDAPSTFFLDVQPDQWPPLHTLLQNEGARGINSSPLVTARLAAVDGVPISELNQRRRSEPTARERQQGAGRDPKRWVLTREQRLTYGDALPRGNTVVAGAFPAEASIANGISVEEEFAKDLGVDLGSTLSFDVQGVTVPFIVTSLRRVDWRTFGINFFLFAHSGPLDEAPQLRVAVARLNSDDLQRVQAAAVAQFPNITVVHIREVMDKVLAVLGRLGFAVQVLAGFTVIAGIIVLGGAIVAEQTRRAREVALLKTLGMTRRDVAAVFAIEYALTGIVAAVIGILAGGILAWAVLTRLMELSWSWPIVDALLTIVAAVALTVTAGLSASAAALASRPIEVLRTQ